jgi:hypothetical protein
MLRPVMVKLMAVALAARVPSRAPAVPVVMGPVKSSWSALIQVPVARLVASAQRQNQPSSLLQLNQVYSRIHQSLDKSSYIQKKE